VLDAARQRAGRISVSEGEPERPVREVRVGWALVGLGPLTLSQVLRAFSRCRESRAVALVGGDPPSMQTLARRYGIPDGAVYGFDTYDRIAHNAEVDIVYVVLPEALHVEYAMRAARAGKHVLCERPIPAAGGSSLSRAAMGADVRLRIAYRHTLELTSEGGEDPLVSEIDRFSQCVRRIAARIAARKGRGRSPRMQETA
jgi:hypothetical protein